MSKEQTQQLLQQIREEKSDYIKKQFSKNPYYVLLRVFGFCWFWHIRKLTEFEETLNK